MRRRVRFLSFLSLPLIGPLSRLALRLSAASRGTITTSLPKASRARNRRARRRPPSPWPFFFTSERRDSAPVLQSRGVGALPGRRRPLADAGLGVSELRGELSQVDPVGGGAHGVRCELAAWRARKRNGKRRFETDKRGKLRDARCLCFRLVGTLALFFFSSLLSLSSSSPPFSRASLRTSPPPILY